MSSFNSILRECLVYVFGALALLGIAALFYVRRKWCTIGSQIQDLAPKVVAEVVQCLAGVTALGAGYAAATDRVEWLRPSIAGAACLVVWKILQILVDNRVLSADRVDKKELERRTRFGEFLVKLLSAIRFGVMRKVKRLRKETKRTGRPGLARVRRALTPEPHLEDLLESLAGFLVAQVPDYDGGDPNFRVGVYVNRDGHMVPVHAVSWNDPGFNPFTSFEAHGVAFRLDTEEAPSHVVRCIRIKAPIVVPDCLSASQEGSFFYFSDGQRTYLRSLTMHYLGKVCDRIGTMTEAVLAIDTNVAGFFREDRREFLEYCLREFTVRLRLELLLLALLPQAESRT